MFNSEVNTHRRVNPLTGENVLVCPRRLERPWKGQREASSQQHEPSTTTASGVCIATSPKSSLSPGAIRANGKINPNYESTFIFDNDFPALTPDNLSPNEIIKNTEASDIECDLFRSDEAKGECKVVCFHPDGNVCMSEMSESEIRVVNDTLAELQEQLQQKWTYVQVWASGFVPDLVRTKDNKQREFFKKHGQSLLHQYVKIEMIKKERIVIETPSWLWLVPYWAVWPYETMLIPKRKCTVFTDLDEQEKTELATIMKRLTLCYDKLFDCSFPYSMGWHGAPNPAKDYPHWQLHASYLPPLLRSRSVKKFMVGYEMMAMPQRDFTPEKAAATLRKVALDANIKILDS